MQGFVRIINSAKRYVYIETPYFLPPEALMFALKTAAASGVDVRLIVPRRSDVRLVEWGCRSYLREAKAAGIKIYLYNTGFLHSKLLVSDDAVCTCGSTNVDFRSFENNFEANTFIYGREVATRMKEIFMSDLRETIAFDNSGKKSARLYVSRFLEGFARMISPLL